MSDDFEKQADDLLRELGMSTGTSDSSSSAPPPPPPPPPPPAGAQGPPKPAKAVTVTIPGKPSTPKAISTSKPSATTADFSEARKEIDAMFDSVLDIAANKPSKVPPPKAPKPQRPSHTFEVTAKKVAPPPQSSRNSPPPTQVSTFSVSVKPKKLDRAKLAKFEKMMGGGAVQDGVPVQKQQPAAPVYDKLAAKPQPPPQAPAQVDVQISKSVEITIKQTQEPSPPAPVATVAFGPGLESFEVNSPGTFQVSCPHDTKEHDLEFQVKGPTGSKPVKIEDLGNGQFSASYLPSMAGEYTVSLKVKGEPVPGSPFTVNVQYASFTDQCIATGPGLISAVTGVTATFKVQFKEDALAARLNVQVLGASKAEPIEVEEIPDENAFNVFYHPRAPGDYNVRVLWGDAHVKGSPFSVPITGDNINDAKRVHVHGAGLSGGEVNESLKFYVTPGVAAGPGPLKMQMSGPSKPQMVVDDPIEEGFPCTYQVAFPGEYSLFIFWGEEEVPGSPFTFEITGEPPEVDSSKCVASGSGLSAGVVGELGVFTVKVNDGAGPGPLAVQISGPHPPQPITLANKEEGVMEVTYNPVAPGDYQVYVTWGEQPIPGSPFQVAITGQATRNAQLVVAEGDPLESGLRCSHPGFLTVRALEGAGPGPLRAKLEGPEKGEMTLTRNPDNSMLVSVTCYVTGEYKLGLSWGDSDEAADIAGSPFTLQVREQ